MPPTTNSNHRPNETPAKSEATVAAASKDSSAVRTLQHRLTLETAHVLFMDIVGYSTLLIDDQTERLRELQEIVRHSEEFQQAQDENQLLRLPTGDGMALVFFDDPEAPLRCAVEVSSALANYPQIKLRMGINSGAVNRIADINANLNVAGGGINKAQRVMDCGDAGHILLSKSVADDLGQLGRWAAHLHDLGEAKVKHGVRLDIFNFYTDEVGNAEVPKKLQKPKPGWSRHNRRPIVAVTVVVVAAFLIAVAWFSLTRLRSGGEQSQAQLSGAATPSSPPSRRNFDYSMVVQRYRNGRPYQKPFTIPGEINFEPDDRIQLWFGSPQRGYLYLINKGPEASVATNLMTLYPDAGQSAFIDTNQPVQIPAPSGNPDEDWISFDKDAGTEQIWIIWSERTVPVLEGVKKWSNPKDLGEIKDGEQDKAVREFLATFEVALAEGKRNQQGTKTTVHGSGEILAYRINLQHH